MPATTHPPTLSTPPRLALRLLLPAPDTKPPGGELYLDEGKAFYAAAHGGAVAKGSLAALLNPFGAAWKVRCAAGGGAGDRGDDAQLLHVPSPHAHPAVPLTQLIPFLFCFFFAQNMKRAKASKLVKDSNLNGDGMTLGGARLGRLQRSWVWLHWRCRHAVRCEPVATLPSLSHRPQVC